MAVDMSQFILVEFNTTTTRGIKYIFGSLGSMNFLLVKEIFASRDLVS